MREKNSNYYLEIEENEKLILPSQRKKHNKKFKIPKTFKWSIIIALAIIIYFNISIFQAIFFNLLKSNPTMYEFYLYLEYQIRNVTFLGIYLMFILGSLFFLALPSEALFIYYLNQGMHFPIIILALGVLGNLTGLIINYGVGRLIGQRFLKWFFKEKKFYNYKEKIDSYGGYIIFLGNILPGPIEVLSVFFGGFKYNFSKYVYLSLMGRLIKFVILLFAFIFYWDTIILYYEIFIDTILFWK